LRSFSVYVLLLFSGVGILSAQKTEYFQDPERILKDGIDLYQKQQYGTAQTHFDDYLNAVQFSGKGSPTRYSISEATYYYAASSVELFQEDALNLMQKFIDNFPESPKINLAHFQMGKIYFRKKDWENAVIEFNKANIYQLTKEQYAEHAFKVGYSYYMVKDYDKSLLYFAKIKDQKNLYQVPAIYYYAHICYLQQKYEVALQHFLLIKDEKKFSQLVPFYITQIYYVQKKYQMAVDYATPIADTLKGPNSGLVRRILAESYFELKNYSKSVEYYNKTIEAGKTLDRIGHYKFGLALYFNKDYQFAGEQLSAATSERDSISQSAYYYLADCLIRTDQKRQALDALHFAHTYDFDKEMSKEALMNFARLAYELGYDPYNEAIDALHTFIATYPNDPKQDEAYELLASIYINTRNYKDALESIGKIKNKSTHLKMAEQRMYLYRGMELFNSASSHNDNSAEYDQAIDHFEKAIEKNLDGQVAALAKFWMGDAYYRQKNYSRAATVFNEFVGTPGAKNLAEYNDGYYNLGYAYFKQKDYSRALLEFQNFVGRASYADRKLSDANVRIADCLFMAKNYKKAIDSYEKAIASSNSQVIDYALMQKGFILGLEGRYDEKALTLERLVRDFSSSSYIEPALFELGKTYLALNRNNDANITFEKLVNEKPNSPYRPKASLQIALIYYNANNFREALGWFKKVVDEYPNTPYMQDAVGYIKKIYIDEYGDNDQWLSYAGSINLQINQGEADSTAYSATEVALKSTDCTKIIDAMGKYLKTYPRGIFSLDANHYKANCHVDLKQYDLAIENLENILNNYGANDYSQDALVTLVEIYELKKDDNNLERTYQLLEQSSPSDALVKKARLGLMRIKFKLKKYNEALTYAQLVKSGGGLDPGQEQLCNFIIGKCYFESGDYDNALPHFKYFAAKTSSEYYPESMYSVAYIQYSKDQMKDAEKTLNKAVKYMGGQKDWLAKSFILLSDVYVSTGDLVQAKSLLQTVIDKTDNQELKDIAQQKLDAIMSNERSTNKSNTEQGLEMDMNDNGKDPKKENNIRN
jgi:TolA-binding protein